jgi:hypothetical protein
VSPTTPAPKPRSTSPGTRTAQILAAVVRQYLSDARDSGYPGTKFPVVFLLDRTVPDVFDGRVDVSRGSGSAISLGDQQWIIDALADRDDLRFVSDRAEVISVSDCSGVRDNGILIQLGTPKGGASRVEVGVYGFVHCRGATWFTYVVDGSSGGWKVTGTTGPMGVA